jgi:2-phospho-L-lactate guanylyltransferase
MTTAVVVPIRAFTLGKIRLASELDATSRADLARAMADGVVKAARDHPTMVVSSAPDVLRWAAALGLVTRPDPGSLDGAATTGREWAAHRGCARVVIAHADLPFVTSFDAAMRDGSREIITIVPCHRDDGTPVISLPSAAPFRFAYGPGSFRRHVTEAHRLGLGTRVLRDPDLAFDVDVPSDLVALGTRHVA